MPMRFLEKRFMNDAELENYKLHRRFDRIGRLIGDEQMKRLMNSSVLVVGLGGVGSWAAEALARSGIGKLILVDYDEVCITNTNRQIQALSSNIGRAKVKVLAERLREINPHLEVIAHTEFYNSVTSNALLQPGGQKVADYVIDAIDHVTAKCHLLSQCRTLGLAVICSTGAGGRMDPTQIQVKDLSETEVDPLAKSIRRILRQQFQFPENGLFGIPAVYSMEYPRDPVELHYDGGKGFRCLCPNKDQNNFNHCEKKNVILGTTAFVTATFGMTCASVVVRKILGEI